VAGLKYPPKIAQSVLPIAPATNPVMGPKSIPKTHGRKANTRQCIAPGISGMGAVNRKPAPVTAEVTAMYAMAVNKSGLLIITDSCDISQSLLLSYYFRVDDINFENLQNHVYGII
jgi:hypothetical protein